MWWLWSKIYEYLYSKKDPLSNYKKDRVLGKGREGDVYSYIDLTTNEEVAIKKTDFVFPPSRFKEALMLKKIKGKHETFLDFRGSIIEGEHEYIITEIARGGTLLDLCDVVDMDTIKDIVYKLLEGISVAHEMNIVHGDLKLENILYNKYTGELKIIDWGFAVNIGKDGYKNKNRECGTMPYVPPEIFLDRMAGQFNDVWSIGIITYALLKLKFPFRSRKETTRIQIKNMKINFKRNFSCPITIDFLKCIFIDYKQRATCKELLQHEWFKN